MLEFTGERVIPGAVDPDLWNEHLARYLFASRLARSKRVLDLGCGTGYGSAELARSATLTVGADAALDALTYAAVHYPSAAYIAAKAGRLPFRDHSFDLITAFEIIEHLEQPEALLQEAQRLLAPGGQLAVSTPNAAAYAEARREAGPNPFHHREFTPAEFLGLLRQYFPHVLAFTQNHASALVFQPLDVPPAAPVIRTDAKPASPDSAAYLVAVCATERQLGAPPFLYIPSAANALRERDQHIGRLRKWLDESLTAHGQLVNQHAEQTQQLEAANRWALQRDGELAEKIRHVETQQQQIAHLHAELERSREQLASLLARLDEADSTIAALHRQVLELRTQADAAHEIFLGLNQARESAEAHAQELASKLDATVNDLAAAVRHLDQSQADLEARTLWAQSLEAELAQQRQILEEAAASRWLRLGRALQLGPNLKP
jgi:SAM-dependent methyltransferase/uncharacterized protein YoxC